MLNLLCDFSSVMATVGRVLLAFVILMFMVLIHETGHYTAGKLLGFKINEFAVGMGPKILSRTKKNGEVVSLRLLPLGGFCAFEGENEDGSDNPQAFNSQKPWKRLIVLFSGAFFNFVSAILIAVITFGCFGDNVAVVSNVYDYAPQANQQLQQGDILFKIDGKRVFILDSVSHYMSDDKAMTFEVLRPSTDEQGNTVYKHVTLDGLTKQKYTSVVLTKVVGEYKSGDVSLAVGDSILKINDIPLSEEGAFSAIYEQLVGECTLTVLSSNGNTLQFQVDSELFKTNKLVVTEQPYSGIGMSIHYAVYKYDFGEVLARTVPYCAETGGYVLRTLGGVITGIFAPESEGAVDIANIGGPISTIVVTSEIVGTGFANILRLIVLISVNLAVFNLLPVPALDGCQMVFVLIEWIARKPINRKVQGYINGIGLIVLIALMVFIDILKL